MAVHNASADAANTAVRVFLTQVGEKYWGKSFNTGTGSGKTIWETIKNEVFNNICCYCGQKVEKVQIEHLIMFNQEEYGLHHPGNVVPCCNDCNKRKKNDQGRHVSWEKHLYLICEESGTPNEYETRRKRIMKHHNQGQFAYPVLNNNEKESIRVIAKSLYNGVKIEIEKSSDLYTKLTEAFVSKR